MKYPCFLGSGSMPSNLFRTGDVFEVHVEGVEVGFATADFPPFRTA
jgi:hypothetical protein